jgi:hypothetical protein
VVPQVADAGQNCQTAQVEEAQHAAAHSAEVVAAEAERPHTSTFDQLKG